MNQILMRGLRGKSGKILALAGLIMVITLAHWTTPSADSSGHFFHVMHITLRKLYMLPVILGAIWFDMTGAITMAIIVSLSYLPIIQSHHEALSGDSVNQWSELFSLWVVALLSGILMKKEKSLLVRLNRMLEGTVEALVAALDFREHHTALHSWRVQAISLWLAKKLAIDPKEYETLRQGALLHDIGKIGIPDQILLKPGPLTDNERAMMNRHPSFGKNIIGLVPAFEKVAELVETHHEHYDGSGYPLGLAQEQIPLAARIFTVADVLDALTSIRPYHQPMSFEAAKQWIESQAGRQFDPLVIDALGSMTPRQWQELQAQVSKEKRHLETMPNHLITR